jgi:hypothetical protein
MIDERGDYERVEALGVGRRTPGVTRDHAAEQIAAALEPHTDVLRVIVLHARRQDVDVMRAVPRALLVEHRAQLLRAQRQRKVVKLETRRLTGFAVDDSVALWIGVARVRRLD